MINANFFISLDLLALDWLLKIDPIVCIMGGYGNISLPHMQWSVLISSNTKVEFTKYNEQQCICVNHFNLEIRLGPHLDKI